MEFVLPAAHGRAIRLARGALVAVTNPFGTQAVDLWAFNADDLGETLSMDNLRSIHSKVAVDEGMALVSTLRRPLLTLVEDSSAGRHDTLLCPCNASLYAQLGHQGYHRSCADNLHEALAGIGLAMPFTPPSLNLFMSTRVEPDGTITRLLPASAPGARVVLRAEMDVVVAFSSCPQDITTINGPGRTPRDCLITVQPGAAP